MSLLKMNELQKIIDRLCDSFPTEIVAKFELIHSDGSKSVISKTIELLYINDFPIEIIFEISEYLTMEELIRFMYTSKYMLRIFKKLCKIRFYRDFNNDIYSDDWDIYYPIWIRYMRLNNRLLGNVSNGINDIPRYIGGIFYHHYPRQTSIQNDCMTHLILENKIISSSLPIAIRQLIVKDELTHIINIQTKKDYDLSKFFEFAVTKRKWKVATYILESCPNIDFDTISIDDLMISVENCEFFEQLYLRLSLETKLKVIYRLSLSLEQFKFAIKHTSVDAPSLLIEYVKYFHFDDAEIIPIVIYLFQMIPGDKSFLLKKYRVFIFYIVNQLYNYIPIDFDNEHAALLRIHGSRLNDDILVKDLIRRVDPVIHALKKENKQQLLFRAAKKGFKVIIESLFLDSGFDPTIFNYRCLKLAKEHNHEKLVEYILSDKRFNHLS